MQLRTLKKQLFISAIGAVNSNMNRNLRFLYFYRAKQNELFSTTDAKGKGETSLIKRTVGYPVDWILYSYNNLGYLLKGLQRQVPIPLLFELYVNLLQFLNNLILEIHLKRRTTLRSKWFIWRVIGSVFQHSFPSAWRLSLWKEAGSSQGMWNA